MFHVETSLHRLVGIPDEIPSFRTALPVVPRFHFLAPPLPVFTDKPARYRWTCTARAYDFKGPHAGPLFDHGFGTYDEDSGPIRGAGCCNQLHWTEAAAKACSLRLGPTYYPVRVNHWWRFEILVLDAWASKQGKKVEIERPPNKPPGMK